MRSDYIFFTPRISVLDPDEVWRIVSEDSLLEAINYSFFERRTLLISYFSFPSPAFIQYFSEIHNFFEPVNRSVFSATIFKTIFEITKDFFSSRGEQLVFREKWENPLVEQRIFVTS